MTEMIGHIAETAGHDEPKTGPVTMGRNPRSRCRNHRSRWSEIPTIVFVLRTGCQWKALPKERFGSASAVHKRFLEWEAAGFFEDLWKSGLAEYDEMEGIAWRWQSIDGAMMKAPLAQEAVGPNPTDRGKKRQQAPPSGGRSWRPLVARRHRGECA